MTLSPEVWDGVLRRLQREVPSFNYEAWLAPLEARAGERGLVLLCPSSFHRERIRDHYLPRIDACLREEIASGASAEPVEAVTIELGVGARRVEPAARVAGSSSRIERGSARPRETRRASRDWPQRPRRRIAGASAADASTPVERDVAGGSAASDFGRSASSETGRSASSETGRSASSETGRSASSETGRAALSQIGPAASSETSSVAAHLRGSDAVPPAEAAASPALPSTAHTFDTFVVGPCNALAREAAFAIAHAQQRGLSQLYLCAASGMGKTHLARAVAAEARQVGANTVQYVSAESFTNQFLSALRANRTGEFKRRYRARHQLLVVEDVQFLERKDATQLEFFHTLAHVLDTGGRVVVTGDRLPSEMTALGDRLRSQLMGGFVAELEAPDAQVRRAIFRAKAAYGGWRLPADCLDYLVDSVAGSVRDLEGALIQLVTTASLLGRPIDLELTRDAISRKRPTHSRPPARFRLEKVIATVAAFFQTTPERLALRSRKQQVLLPRQIAMYLCRRYTDASIAEIAEALGRDHPSVRNAIAKIERAILEKPKLRYQIEAVVERLEADAR